MAKGRKLTTSRSERYLGTNYNPAQGTVNGSSELREEDVWSINDSDDDNSTNGAEWTHPRASLNNNNYMTRRQPPPRADRQTSGGLSIAFHDSNSNSPRIVHQFRTQESVTESPRGRHMATSAPVNVPDWSKIYRVDSVDSLHDSLGFVDDDVHDSELVPPHEYLAREYSRKTAANSVFEGVGRTLKGRDLSRVRDAVWSQTGFDG